MSISISAAWRFLFQYQRRVGLFAASIFINALILLSILSIADSNRSQLGVRSFENDLEVIEIEFVEEFVEATPEEPQIDIQPKITKEEAPLEEDIPQDEQEAASEPVVKIVQQSEETAEPVVKEKSREKKTELAISPRWQVDRSGMTLEEQSTGVFLPNTAVGSGFDGDIAAIRRALNMAACLDIETARIAGAACAELGAMARYNANNPVQQRIISSFADQFQRSQAIPFVKKEEYDLTKGPLPEGMASSDTRSRAGGVSTSALPDPHPHAYDEVTRGN